MRILGPATNRTSLAEHLFGVARAILVEFVPHRLAREPIADGQTVGAVPRT